MVYVYLPKRFFLVQFYQWWILLWITQTILHRASSAWQMMVFMYFSNYFHVEVLLNDWAQDPSRNCVGINYSWLLQNFNKKQSCNKLLDHNIPGAGMRSLHALHGLQLLLASVPRSIEIWLLQLFTVQALYSVPWGQKFHYQLLQNQS